MEAQTTLISSSPLVSSIADTLTERILAGGYQDRNGFPSERELIEEFGVSRAIIRKALDHMEARRLLIRAPRCKTLVRLPVNEDQGQNDLTRKEPGRRSIALGMWPDPTDPASASVAQGICQALEQSNFRLVIGSFTWDSRRSVFNSQKRFLEQVSEDGDIAGVLLWYLGSEESLPALKKVRSANIPMVFVDRRPPGGFDADYVGVENESAACQVVRHLIAQGHRRIAHITNGDPASTVAERLAGYRRTLMEAGILTHPDQVVRALESSLAEVKAMYEGLAEQLLTLPDPPTAVFAVNDVVANRFIAALQSRGLRVPEDIAVAGFDGIERWTSGEPFLTTVHQPFELLGKYAADLLFQRIEAGGTLPYRSIVLEAPLRIHGSTLYQRRDSYTGS